MKTFLAANHLGHSFKSLQMVLVAGLMPLLLFSMTSCNQPSAMQGNEDNSTDVSRVHTDTTEKFSHREARPSTDSPNAITCAFEDRKGRIWFGSNQQGIYRYDGLGEMADEPSMLSHFHKENGFFSNHVTVITEDLEGHPWMGTKDGLVNWDGFRFNNIPIPQQDTSSLWLDQVYPVVDPNRISSLVQDDSGRFWIGTSGGGGYRYDCSSFTPILRGVGHKFEDSLHHSVIQHIQKDSEGNLWFSSMSRGGIYRLEDTSTDLKDGTKLSNANNTDYWTHFSTADGLTHQGVDNTFQDSRGVIWANVRGEGLHILDADGQRFRKIAESVDACEVTASCFFEDSAGKIWIGSGIRGVCIYTPSKKPNELGSFSPFEGPDGQTLLGIQSIIQDKNGYVWLCGSDNQLWRYDGEHLVDFRSMMEHLRI